MLPLSASTGDSKSKKETIIPTPTHDGGLEHTAATFADASDWLAKCRAGQITLYPPQLYLMSLVADFMATPTSTADPPKSYAAQREALLEFLRRTPTVRTGADAKAQKHPTASIPWADKVMSPTMLFMRSEDQRVVLGLDKPGPELQVTGRGGDYDRVVLVKFRKDGPQGVELRWREDVLAEERAAEAASADGEGSKGAKL
jgi:hypothetical protein